MRAFVRIRTPDAQTVVLGPGDIIGRLATAALHLDDGRISEAHAMVSLRGRELKLLALRGLFAVAGKPIDEIVLREGLAVELARGLEIYVEDVVLPTALLAIEGEGLPRQVLAGTSSLVPVSYTHLDVYKRQPRESSDSGRGQQVPPSRLTSTPAVPCDRAPSPGTPRVRGCRRGGRFMSFPWRCREAPSPMSPQSRSGCLLYTSR